VKGARRSPQGAADVGRADLGATLKAFDVDELRAFLVEALEALDEVPRLRLQTSLLQRAATKNAAPRSGATSPPAAATIANVLPPAPPPRQGAPATRPAPPTSTAPTTSASPPGGVAPPRTAFDYLAEVGAHLAAGRADEAIRCAEASLAIWPHGLKGRFQRKLGEAYAAKGQPDRAVEAVWMGFLEDPEPETFRTLRRRAKAAGAWPAWRQRAIDHLAIEHPQTKKAASALVDIFLFEGKPLDALREARRRPIFPRAWLMLAGGLAAEHPREALAVFDEKVVPQFSSSPSRQRLIDIVKVMRALQQGASAAGLGEGFKALVAKIRRDFERKQWLMEVLAKEGWAESAGRGSASR
jgi:tetratricopeptide (TPR) repeat protein